MHRDLEVADLFQPRLYLLGFLLQVLFRVDHFLGFVGVASLDLLQRRLEGLQLVLVLRLGLLDVFLLLLVGIDILLVPLQR